MTQNSSVDAHRDKICVSTEVPDMKPLVKYVGSLFVRKESILSLILILATFYQLYGRYFYYFFSFFSSIFFRKCQSCWKFLVDLFKCYQIPFLCLFRYNLMIGVLSNWRIESSYIFIWYGNIMICFGLMTICSCLVEQH